jgi:hypothetical protein
MKINPGCGYWDITQYPIGGCFRRVPKNSEGLIITDIVPLDRPYRGCTHQGLTEDSKVAFNLEHTSP